MYMGEMHFSEEKRGVDEWRKKGGWKGLGGEEGRMEGKPVIGLGKNN